MPGTGVRPPNALDALLWSPSHGQRQTTVTARPAGASMPAAVIHPGWRDLAAAAS